MAINSAHLGVIRSLTLDDLVVLNRAVVEQINTKRAIKTFQAIRQFVPGDVVQFRSSQTGRMVLMRVDRLNSKSVGGSELDPVTRARTGRTWRVHPSFLTPAPNPAV